MKFTEGNDMDLLERAGLFREGFALMAEMDTVVSGSDREESIVKRLDELDAILGEDWWDLDIPTKD